MTLNLNADDVAVATLGVCSCDLNGNAMMWTAQTIKNYVMWPLTWVHQFVASS